MKEYLLEKDINVFCITAKSFPEGIIDAQQQLHSLFPFSNNRRYFGLSRPEKGMIKYKAAAEEINQGEADKFGCETFIIEKGKYISILIKNYANDIQSIGRAFTELIANPDIDPNGICVEWYLNAKDVRCMVRLDPKENGENDILSELKTGFKCLQELVSSFDEKQLNKVPFEGSWTAAQVCDHLAKSYGFIKTLLSGNTVKTERPINAKIKDIRTHFLNFDTKMKSPDFIVPSSEPVIKSILLNELALKTADFIEMVQTKNLSKTCLDFQFQGIGSLTGLEWTHFVLYHTQRHIHQLKNTFHHI